MVSADGGGTHLIAPILKELRGILVTGAPMSL